MSLLGFGRHTIGSSTTFTLTPAGKKKAEEFGSDSRSRVMVAIEELGASNIKEICDEAHISRGKCESIVKSLIKSGYVHVMRGEEE